MKKNKKIIFITSFIVFIISAVILLSHLTMNIDNYYVHINTGDFIPTIKLEEIKEENKNINILLKDFDRINMKNERKLYIEIIGNSKTNKLTYSFNGDYELKDRLLTIDNNIPLTYKGYYPIRIYVTKDISNILKIKEMTYTNNDINTVLQEVKAKEYHYTKEKVNEMLTNLEEENSWNEFSDDGLGFYFNSYYVRRERNNIELYYDYGYELLMKIPRNEVPYTYTIDKDILTISEINSNNSWSFKNSNEGETYDY